MTHRTGHSDRRVVRILVAIALALIAFVIWSSNVGRGFLPGWRVEIFVVLDPTTADGIRFATEEQVMDGRGTQFPTLRLIEQSMGRTDTGLGGRWRSAVWWIDGVVLPDGEWQAWEDAVELRTAETDAAVRHFVEEKIVSCSRAWETWPRRPDELIEFDDTVWMWSCKQRRSTPRFPVVAGLASMLIGALAAAVLLPESPRRSDAGPDAT